MERDGNERRTALPSTDEQDGVIAPNTEVGFFFLKSTPITINIQNSKQSLNFTKGWVDVTVNNMESEEQSESQEQSCLPCPRCNLVLSSRDGNHLEFNPHTLYSFSGMVKDIKCCS